MFGGPAGPAGAGRFDGLASVPVGGTLGRGLGPTFDPWAEGVPIPEAAATAAARTLAERALAAGSMDNITVVVLALQWL